eukprot:gnl/TRDRNA2_/TRDRNA2_132055_c1_seq1.p1 gnl/TRDRNA2_/TRDRNA2_132055_c1~~gnl/TRDRNA2_/TRDRNA2_132055_c1_seq1.p1  ORF type:complete len:199 (-),score=41.92 gnl/TRDRNA2_/TRDRNA2_132055_c1_seq1:99-695(-)
MAFRTLVIASLAACAAAQGGCSADDQTTILDHYKTGDISFGEKDNSCTHSAFSIFSGFNKDSMVSCVEDKIGLSESCSECFADHGAFAVASCKLPCLFSWCSARCIGCLKADHPKLNKCTGFTYPHLVGCNGPVIDDEALMLDEVPESDLIAESSPSGISFAAAGLIGFFAGSVITFATYRVRRAARATAEEPLLVAS